MSGGHVSHATANALAPLPRPKPLDGQDVEQVASKCAGPLGRG
jgi:hypothetical protein